MQRITTFILLLALSAMQCSSATIVVEKSTSSSSSSSSSNLRKSKTTHDNAFATATIVPRELSSTSSNTDASYFWANLWYNVMTKVCPPNHKMCPHPCGPPHDQCHHHHKSSGSSSSSSSSSGGSSSGGGSSSSSSGGSSSSSGGGGSSSNNWHNDGYDNNSSGNDNSVDYNSENSENWSTDGGDWSHDGWDSSNLDTGTSSGMSGLNVAQSVVPFIFGALMVGLIAAALVVMRKRRQAEDNAHPLEGVLKKRMKLFTGGIFQKKRGMLDDDIIGHDEAANNPAFVEISSVSSEQQQQRNNSSYAAPIAPTLSNAKPRGFANEDSDSDVDSEL